MKRKVILSLVFILTLTGGINLSIKKNYASDNEITELAKSLTETANKIIPNSSLIKYVNDTLVFFNGEQVTDLSIYNYNSSTYLPLRAIGDLLGAKVNWFAEDMVAQVSLDNTQIEVLNNTNTVIVKKDNNIEESKITATSNGQSVDLPALNIKGTIYLPLRYISETLGVNIDYTSNHEKTGVKTIEIYKGEKPSINYVRDLIPIAIVRPLESDVVYQTFGSSDTAWVDPVTKKAIFYSTYYDSQDESTRFSEGLIAIESGGLWGFMNKKGEIVIDVKYYVPQEARYFSEGLVAIKDYRNYGYMDAKGNFVIQPQFKDARAFNEGLAAVQDKKTDKWGYIDKTGKYVIPPQFSSALDFNDGIACVYTEKKTEYGIDYELYYIDKNGKTLLKDKRLQSVSADDFSFSNGLAPSQANGPNSTKYSDGFGYIDITGKFVIPPQFRWAYPFSEGLACVEDPKTNLHGFIDTTGKLVIPYQYKYVQQGFKNGIAKVINKDGISMYIDKNGNEIISSTLWNFEEAVDTIIDAKHIGEIRYEKWNETIEFKKIIRENTKNK